MFRSFFSKKYQRETININHHEPNINNQTLHVSKTLQTNIDNLTQLLDDPEDLKIRFLQISESNIKIATVFFEGIVDPISTEQSVLNNLEMQKELPLNTIELFDYINNKLIAINDVQKEANFNKIIDYLLSGMTIFFMDGIEHVLVINTIGGNFRQIDEPVTETLIRGPRDGFVENIQTNLALIRRGIRDPNLRFKAYTAGKRSKNNLVVTYVEGDRKTVE